MNGLKPIKIPSAKEKVASELRKAILSRKMKEGEILSLDSVATQLNVSITPVREAFQILARDGLIKLRQNKGAIVLGITDTYIREHYQLRAILESACAGLAAEEGVDISGIRDSYEESKAALENGDYSQYASQNREFHSEIWAAAGNKKMEIFAYSCSVTIFPIDNPFHSSAIIFSIEEHGRIMDAIAAGDGERAKKEMYAHIMRSRDDMLTYYQ